jgi:hypothetical protein
MLWVARNKPAAIPATLRSKVLDMNSSLGFASQAVLLFEIYKHLSLQIKGMWLE